MNFVKKFRLIDPILIFNHFWKYRELILQLTRKNISERYKGSYLGLSWAFIHPLIMLSIYTLIFGFVFKARWAGCPENNQFLFSMILFVGLITFGIFSDVIVAAPRLILSHASYAKSVIMPLEILVIVRVLSATVHALLSMIILFIGLLISQHSFSWTILLFPVIWLPMMLGTAGLAFFLASLGVFIRDIDQGIRSLVLIVLYLSAIFYPVNRLPLSIQRISFLNPMIIFVNDTRNAIIFGQLPSFTLSIAMYLVCYIIFCIGFWLFIKSKAAFADVL